jgi:peptidoglycan/xylan/chitin deacetylase (PgdA/CDA1 family)
MSGPQAEEEVIGSRTDLERALETTITTFAYPYGEFDASTEGLVERAGFLGSCGVVDGFNDAATPVQALCRTEVFGTDSLITFALRLLGQRVRHRPRARLVPRTGRTASSANAL